MRDIEPAAALGHVGALSSQVASFVSKAEILRRGAGGVRAAGARHRPCCLFGVLWRNLSQRRREMGLAPGSVRHGVLESGWSCVRFFHGCWSRGRGARRRSRRATLQPLLFGITPLLVPCHAGNPAGGGGARLRCSRAARRRNRSVDDAAGWLNGRALAALSRPAAARVHRTRSVQPIAPVRPPRGG